MEGKEEYQVIFSFLACDMDIEELVMVIKAMVPTSSPVTVKKVVDKIATNEVRYTQFNREVEWSYSCGVGL